MGKYSDPGFTMAIAGTEAAYPLVAVAIDNHNKTSQVALKWAVEFLVKRGQTLVLVHVNTKGTSTGLVDASGYKQPDEQLRELFLPYRCFCTRKDVNCKDVVIDGGDVVRGLTEFIASASIEIMVLGSPSRGVLRRFKNSDVPISVSKGASDFCTVYIIGKEKVSNVRNAIRAAPTVSPLRPQMSNPSVPDPFLHRSHSNPTNQHRLLFHGPLLLIMIYVGLMCYIMAYFVLNYLNYF